MKYGWRGLAITIPVNEPTRASFLLDSPRAARSPPDRHSPAARRALASGGATGGPATPVSVTGVAVTVSRATPINGDKGVADEALQPERTSGRGYSTRRSRSSDRGRQSSAEPAVRPRVTRTAVQFFESLAAPQQQRVTPTAVATSETCVSLEQGPLDTSREGPSVILQLQKGPMGTLLSQTGPLDTALSWRGPLKTSLSQRGLLETSLSQKGPSESSPSQRGPLETSLSEKGTLRSLFDFNTPNVDRTTWPAVTLAPSTVYAARQLTSSLSSTEPDDCVQSAALPLAGSGNKMAAGCRRVQDRIATFNCADVAVTAVGKEVDRSQRSVWPMGAIDVSPRPIPDVDTRTSIVRRIVVPSGQVTHGELQSDIKGKTPSVEDIKDKSPGIEDINAVLSGIEDIKENLASIEDVKENLAAIENINDKLPRIEDINVALSGIEDVKENIAGIENINDKLPGIEDINAVLSGIEDIQEKTSGIEDINAALSGIEDIKENRPGIEDINVVLSGIEDIKENVAGIESINDKLPGIEDINAVLLGIEDIKKNRPGIEDIKEDRAGIENVKDKSPGIEGINVVLSSIEDIKDKSPGIEDINAELSGIEDIKENLASIEDVKENVAGIENINDKLPGIEDINAVLSGIEDIKKNRPGIEDINVVLSGIEDVKENIAGIENINDKLPGIEDINAVLLGIEDIKKNRPGIEDIKEDRAGIENVKDKSPGIEGINVVLSSIEDVNAVLSGIGDIKEKSPGIEDKIEKCIDEILSWTQSNVNRANDAAERISQYRGCHLETEASRHGVHETVIPKVFDDNLTETIKKTSVGTCDFLSAENWSTVNPQRLTDRSQDTSDDQEGLDDEEDLDDEEGLDELFDRVAMPVPRGLGRRRDGPSSSDKSEAPLARKDARREECDRRRPSTEVASSQATRAGAVHVRPSRRSPAARFAPGCKPETVMPVPPIRGFSPDGRVDCEFSDADDGDATSVGGRRRDRLSATPASWSADDDSGVFSTVATDASDDADGHGSTSRYEETRRLRDDAMPPLARDEDAARSWGQRRRGLPSYLMTQSADGAALCAGDSSALANQLLEAVLSASRSVEQFTADKCANVSRGADTSELSRRAGSRDAELRRAGSRDAELSRGANASDTELSRRATSRDAELSRGANASDTELRRAGSRDAELSRRASSRDAELSRIATSHDAELSRGANASDAELSRLASSRDAELSRRASSLDVGLGRSVYSRDIEFSGSATSCGGADLSGISRDPSVGLAPNRPLLDRDDVLALISGDIAPSETADDWGEYSDPSSPHSPLSQPAGWPEALDNLVPTRSAYIPYL